MSEERTETTIAVNLNYRELAELISFMEDVVFDEAVASAYEKLVQARDAMESEFGN